MAAEVTAADIRAYVQGLTGAPWRSPSPAVSFLARGEYSLNFRVAGDYVVRLVTGSQLELPLGDQARYEHHALQLVGPSGSTPRPHRVDPDPAGLPWPVIIEGYLPGRPLDYATDLAAAARCVAGIHALGVPDRHRLRRRPEPGPALLEESRRLVAPYLGWPGGDQASKQALRAGLARAGELVQPAARPDAGELAIVNGDLNTHNFVVDGGEAQLVDWEQARVAPPAQDLAHFLLPTTTLWREETAARLTDRQEEHFLDTYLQHHPRADRDRFLARLRELRRLVALRALCWCAWAVQAAGRGERAIVNEETLRSSRSYLQPAFVSELLGR